MTGHLRERGKGNWVVVLELGRDAQGKRRQKWHPVKGTKRDAQRELARLVNEVNQGSYVEPSRMKVEDYLQRWLRDYAKANVTAKTYSGYEEFIRVHISPALGHHLLEKLTPLHIQAYYAKALRTGRRDGKGGLSARTVLHHHRVLRKALHQAVKWQLLARNPADAVDPPRAIGCEMRALDEMQTARLLRAARGKRLEMPITIAVYTGLRRGEILALRWEDVDLAAGTLSVRQSLERTSAGLSFKQPKTSKSRRVVALPELLVTELRRHRAEQAQVRLKMGHAYQDHGLVVANPNGAPMSPSGLSIAFGILVDRLDLPSVRFHDLRHTHASQLLRLGIHPKVVSERLGHSTVGITLDIYSHVLPGMQEDAAFKLDCALRHAIDDDLRRMG